MQTSVRGTSTGIVTLTVGQFIQPVKIQCTRTPLVLPRAKQRFAKGMNRITMGSSTA